MDLGDYEVKNTTKCKCGHEFTIRDMKCLQRLQEPCYGGIVKHADEIKCPNCKRDTLLLIKQEGQTYIVKDIAQKEDISIAKNEIDLEVSQDRGTEASTISTEVQKDTSNEIICPVCQRTFKNKSGLTIHMKTHETLKY